MKSALILSICSMCALILAAPTAAGDLSTLTIRAETPQQATDRLLFSSTMAQFTAARNAKDPPSLNWESDGCSHSPDKPGFNFLPSCYRHDFGYRNYKAQDRFTRDNKKKIDRLFRSDLYDECAKEENDLRKTECTEIANVRNIRKPFGLHMAEIPCRYQSKEH
ncbi:phospholipase A2 group XIII [Histoplasma capsulatum G186AR]|uniref:Phospholipase A2 group XIII n=1 Tax=Ajellomyces capsulatus (strain G186AR / H82 / ATCC MYA-2454 / RMSCC 2432) TaxID=447093 RepID=C0NTA5_AJECG|nr:phospholipase A2 group XIII [Histoplasma capsulatum G186AR]EEH05266.1 phospholipase A2 group XIII [Histoplasma capsulatum G186AR]